MSNRNERATIGVMLRYPQIAVPEVAHVLKPSNFLVRVHGVIFAAVLELWNAGKPVDMASVFAAIKPSDRVDFGPEESSCAQFLATLWDESPSAADPEYYAFAVLDESILRQLAEAGRRIEDLAKHPTGPASELLNEAEKLVFGISQLGATSQAYPVPIVISEAMDAVDEIVIQRKEGVSRGLLTGWDDLDFKLGGLHDSEFCVIAARPGVGKTAVALNLFYNVAVRQCVPAFFASVEMSRVELGKRLLCMHGLVDSYRIRSGTLSNEESERLLNARGDLGQAIGWIDDASSQPMQRIVGTARRLAMRSGIKLVIVDYLQIVDPESKREPRQEQVSGIARRLKQLARELKIPVVALAQLNRGVENRTDQTPRLADLRESGSIEQEADTVLLLSSPPDDSEERPTRLIDVTIAKQRNGPTGKVSLVFRKPFMRVESFGGDL